MRGRVVLTVVGVDGSPLHPDATAALAHAEVVAGAARYLHLAPAGAERVAMGPVDAALDALDGRRGVVLASGDPGFFGIVRLLRARGHEPVVLPARSSVQRAFARIGRPWDDVAVVSAHGRALGPAVNVCRARAATAVLTAPGAGPAEIGAALQGWERTLVVAEDLDGPDERVTTVTPHEAAGRVWRDPNVVLCLRDPDAVPGTAWIAGGPPRPGGWALPDDAFAHRAGMVTKSEVRALALARLAPAPGALVWDVGAGSGSVGVECARLGAAVVAVEHRPDDAARVRENAAAHGVDVRVVEGQAPAALAGLPQPDAVFVGGGGPDVVAAAAATGAARVVVALAALDRLAPTRDALHAYRVEGVQLAASRLADLPGGSVRLAATNPILLLWGEL
ncbi:precorrin-6y C5,15-methyltransferase (decarboxylating) subunit CbiE [Pseudonocardia sp. KRD-184]|uniref:Precorrin-6y C5,15-methyltransferase (Decarboxylating) subunit CbiE n=1 Tax=Pseudonocardia oceani TaxID=2792013 RepID=A0ABS6U3R7_9PSEU|nr:precorrin-6y C5,15-methyltransferase (decarboxylating) subunit CbiE [Pseudonocardia oceani]MBW0098093.1 precorrin-6y C5,15-methyltransferase (decarboxylating) subunit CbiE [Pseudonocardia oceani]MBW0112354.1 precorrin-6y C5,15-methyltransferase (decarboxylating) subunit CbiE [Pseudonocardia oceani]MBW0124702.1 precorrin-6y C5,15-methyltransferase (decarboxylating) subunit CbiE [Pseudonocardia oceani]MBW0126875.1 precorrin-6y C5,15-methyltransferase (decarboxylating) subunit CbiE [Pseudonocar